MVTVGRFRNAAVPREVCRSALQAARGAGLDSGRSNGETATLTRTDPTSLETPAGPVDWDQPLARLNKQRRDPFAVQTLSDAHAG